MKNTFIIALLWCSVLSFGQIKETPAKQDTLQKKAILLNQVIVTGNIKTDPTLTIVKQDYKDKVSQPKSSGELFADINGFSLIKRGNYAVDPSFRASQYEQLNVQYDGGTKAFHACPNRMDPITTLINPEEVTRIEIIKGPFSVRYGNTFAGVINLVTQNGNDTGKKISGSVSSGYESNGNSIVNLLQLESDLDKFDISGSLSYRDYGNYEDGNQNEIASAFRSLGYGLKMGYDFTENQRLQASIHQNFGRAILHAGLPMDTKEDNSTITNLDYKWVNNGTVFKGLSAKAYYSFVNHIMDNSRRLTFETSENIADVEATTYGGKIESEWNFIEKWKLFAGADMVNLSRDGGRDRLAKRNMAGVLLPIPIAYYDKLWQDSYNNTVGTFVEAKWFASQKSIFSFGARVDFVASDANDLGDKFKALYPNLERRNETTFSGTVSYKRLLNSYYTLEAALGRGTRAASLEERFIGFVNIGRDSYMYIGNPNLKSEVNNQLEISFTGKEKLNGIFNQIKFGGAAYYSIYENYILAVIKPGSTTEKVYSNIADALKTGFEFYGDLKFANHFNFLTEVAYVYTENKDFNENLPLTPPLVTRLKLGYELDNFWASVQYNLTARQPKISNSYGESTTSGYEVMDVKAGFSPVKNLNLGIGVLNVFDQYYNNHLTFAFKDQPDISNANRIPITEAGRNFTLFVNYKF